MINKINFLTLWFYFNKMCKIMATRTTKIPFKITHTHTHTTEQCTNSRPLKETIGTRFVTLCCKIHRYSYSRNNHILITVPLMIAKYVLLTIAKQSFLKTLWLMMMYHHTVWLQKIKYFRTLSSRQTFNEVWTFALTMDLNALKQSFYRTVDIPSKFGSKKISSLEDTIKTVTSRFYEPQIWPWPWRQQPNIFTGYFSSWWSSIKLSLVAKKLLVHNM